MHSEQWYSRNLVIHKRKMSSMESLSGVRNTPIRALQHATRYKMTELLDPPGNNDWRMFAQHCGVDFSRAEFIDTMVEKTRMVLRDLQDIQRDATFGTILDILERMERRDVIQDIEQLLLADAEFYERSLVQDPQVSSAETMQLTLGDREGEIEWFDAFVSFHPQDIQFVDTLIENLEVMDQFKICLTARNLLDGLPTHFVAKVLAERCKRVLVVISRSYVEDHSLVEDLAFELDIAQGLAPAARNMVKVIPIVIEQGVRVPLTLGPYVPADYTRPSHRVWFWDKLKASLKRLTNRGGGYLGPDVPYVKLYQPNVYLD